MAIAYGNYSIAYYLKDKGLKPRSKETYEEYRELRRLNYCDYESFLLLLNAGVPPSEAPRLNIRPSDSKHISEIFPKITYNR